jgi:hypothetical protein
VRRGVLVLGLVLLASAAAESGCSKPAEGARDEASARRDFDRWLHARLEQPEWVPEDTAGLDLGDECGVRDTTYARLYWMASYRIVSVRVDGDRATGVVDVLAAGEQGPDPDHVYPTRANLRVAHHVLRFPMRREPGHGRWRVCYTSTSGWQLGHEISPHNIGIDHEVIFQAIDSIRGVPYRRWYNFPR